MIKLFFTTILALTLKLFTAQDNGPVTYILLSKKDSIKVNSRRYAERSGLSILIYHEWEKPDYRYKKATIKEHNFIFYNTWKNADSNTVFKKELGASDLKKYCKISLNKFVELLNKPGAINVYKQRFGLIVPVKKNSYTIYYVNYYDMDPEE